MQKVRTTFSRCLAVLIIGVLAWSTMMLLPPSDAEGLVLSYRQPVQAEFSAQPLDPDADLSAGTITVRINGVPYTYYAQAFSSEVSPALKPLATVPATPTGVKVLSVGSGKVDLTWNRNTDSNLKGYRVAYKPEGGTYQSFFTTSTSCTITGLKNGVKYTLKVKAQNTNGDYSTYSSHVYATPKASPPSTPTGLKTISIGNGRIDVVWNANPEKDVQYRLAYKPSGGDYKSVLTSDTKYSLTGLTNGVSYTLKVKAINTENDESTYCSFVYATPQAASKPADGGSITNPPQSAPNVKVETLAAGTKYATSLYVISSNKPGPVVMVVGGVHGNEKAGYTAARRISDYKVSRGTLLVIPEANKLAIQANRRSASGGTDLNRDFPQSTSQAPKTVLSNAIYKTIKEYKVDWLIDLHEGYEYHKNPKANSVGQTLIYYPANSALGTAQGIVNDLNKGISSSYRQFTLLRYPVKGSLARAAGDFLGVRSMIFETCSQPTLSTRVNYQIQAVNKLLSSLNMR